jgi:hypothetical protein
MMLSTTNYNHSLAYLLVTYSHTTAISSQWRTSLI